MSPVLWKTLGLIGGTSWTSTADYYRYINEETAQALGGLHSARLVLVSLDFAELIEATNAKRQGAVVDMLKTAASDLCAAKADAILLCANTLHRHFDDVQKETNIPLLHIADAVAHEITARQYQTVGLLGTALTMEEPFYADRIKQKSGATVIVPSPKERAYVNEAIFDRMCRDIYSNDDRTKFVKIISALKTCGAEAVILGCTELPVLLQEAPLPLLNSTQLHSRMAVRWALSPETPTTLRAIAGRTVRRKTPDGPI